MQIGGIDEWVFSFGGLKSILIPSSVDVLGQSSFFQCKSLESVTFENCSRLERIEESAFSWSGLKSIVTPSVDFLGTSMEEEVELEVEEEEEECL
jgi:hypothetical protein